MGENMPSKNYALVASAFVALVVSSATAAAQDLSQNISCLNGRVPGADYAELGEKLKESIFDTRGGVALYASHGGVELRVEDAYQRSVCDETAYNSTSCKFKLNISTIEEFTITVDNHQNSEEVTYKLCAF